MESTQILTLCLFGAAFLVIGLIVAIGSTYSLKGIPNKPVGNGQHGTARFATPREISNTYKQIPYTPELWRKEQQLPTVDGLIVGSKHDGALFRGYDRNEHRGDIEQKLRTREIP